MLRKNMPKKQFLLVVVIFGLLLPNHSLGFETKGQDCAKCHTLSQTEANDLLKNFFPDIKILEIRVSPSKALWEILSESGGKKGLLYVDFSKQYFIPGPMISIRDRKNLSQERLNDLVRIDVSQIPLDDALVVGDPKAPIRIIAFDDPD